MDNRLALYAATIAEDVGHYHIEFYWAEDAEHAEEQAEDANPRPAIVLCVARVPYAANEFAGADF